MGRRSKKIVPKLSTPNAKFSFNGVVNKGLIHGFKVKGMYCKAIPDFINGKCRVISTSGSRAIDEIVNLDDVNLLISTDRKDKYGKELFSDDLIAVNVAAGSHEWIVGRLHYRSGYWLVGHTDSYNSILFEGIPILPEHTTVKIGNAFDDCELARSLSGTRFTVSYNGDLEPEGLIYDSQEGNDNVEIIPDWLKSFNKITSFI